jgi:hypothetical protein
VVAALLKSGGQDALPIVLVDGKIRFSGTWPSRAELAAPLGVVVPLVGADLLAPGEDPCCTPMEQVTTGCCAPTVQGTTGCCNPAEKATTGCCSPAEQASAPQTAEAACATR